MSKMLQLISIAMILLAVSTVANAQSWQLVWQDEFIGNQINLSKWEHEVNGNGGGNNELQFYTARDTNSYVEYGNLVIQTLTENYSGNQYTSARLRTLNQGDWKYGRVEVRAKLPAGTGTWPAIWMLPTDWVYGGWPNSGEIDIMEHVGYEPGAIHGTVHTQAYNHTNGTQVGAVTGVPDFDTNFHVYALEWTPLQIRVYVDNNHYFTFNNQNQGWQTWPFDQRFHLILNIAIGGDWGGAQGVDDSIFPVKMYIDYVRVYQNSASAPTINMLNPAPGTNFQPGETIQIDVESNDTDGTVQKVELFQGEAKIGQDDVSPYEFSIDNAYSGCYELKAVATDNDGYVTATDPVGITVGSGCGKSPYGIQPEPIPGIIEMENYDMGGAGVSYNDNDVANQGNAFRVGEGVDIEVASDIGSGYNIGFIESGEWVEYLVDVEYSGSHSVISRVASETGGGSFVIEMDGEVVAGPITVNATGGWQTWQSVFTENVQLTRGIHVMRVRFISGSFNINKLTIFAVSVGTEPDPVNPLPTEFALEQNYPNPFNPSTTIRYSLPENDAVKLVVYDIVGKEVATLINDRQQPGKYEINFDAQHLQSGTYFFRLSTSQHSAIRKMLLIK